MINSPNVYKSQTILQLAN